MQQKYSTKKTALRRVCTIFIIIMALPPGKIITEPSTSELESDGVRLLLVSPYNSKQYIEIPFSKIPADLNGHMDFKLYSAMLEFTIRVILKVEPVIKFPRNSLGEFGILLFTHMFDKHDFDTKSVTLPKQLYNMSFEEIRSRTIGLNGMMSVLRYVEPNLIRRLPMPQAELATVYEQAFKNYNLAYTMEYIQAVLRDPLFAHDKKRVDAICNFGANAAAKWGEKMRASQAASNIQPAPSVNKPDRIKRYRVVEKNQSAIESVNPGEQVRSAEPVKPVETEKPVEIAKPVESAKPIELAKSAEPAKPIEPEKPVELVKPVKPEKPVELAKPIEPEKPVELAKPIEPEKPVEPVKIVRMDRLDEKVQSTEAVNPVERPGVPDVSKPPVTTEPPKTSEPRKPTEPASTIIPTGATVVTDPPETHLDIAKREQEQESELVTTIKSIMHAATPVIHTGNIVVASSDQTGVVGV
jgi:hypothetical protein